MDEVSASTKIDIELKVVGESNQEKDAAARRRMEKRRRRIKVMGKGSTVEENPVSKRFRPCSGDVKPSSSCIHVLTIPTSSSFSSIQTVIDRHDDYDNGDGEGEGEGECIPFVPNHNTFEHAISPSLQHQQISKHAEEEEEEENYSSTLDGDTPTLPKMSIGTCQSICCDESSGDLCSSVTESLTNSERDGYVSESPPWAESIANPLASPPEEVFSGDTELVSTLDLQSAQTDHQAVGDSASISATVLVPSATGRNDRGSRTNCVAKNQVLPWGCVSIRGKRAEMEDAMAVAPEFLSIPCGTVGGCVANGSDMSNEISPLHFFGVYDGHGGPQAADFCRDRLHHAFVEEFGVAMNGESVNTSGGGQNNWQGKWERAFASCFHKVDVEVGGGVVSRDCDGQVTVAECCGDPIVPETVGSTAVVAVVGSCQIIVSNCGDSRAVLSRGGRAIALSVDHKPDREDELARIEAAGGKVINWNGYRVFGVLAMSRAIGDPYLKPSVIPDPEVTFTQRTEEDDFLILASDGLWDVLSNEEACGAARRCLARGYNGKRSSSSNVKYPSAQAAADHLLRLAQERNSSDNITIIVVDLKAKSRHESRTSKMITKSSLSLN